MNKYVGKKYNRLTVKERTDLRYKNGTAKYKCECECGKVIYIQISSLLRGISKSCGCLQKEENRKRNWTGCGEIAGYVFRSIEKNAKQRNLKFEITKEYLWDLFLIQKRRCAITGVSIFFNNKRAKGRRTASFDRINNKLGYIEGNVQWIHKTVNFMKYTMTVSQLKSWSKLIVNGIPDKME